jgi:hypothetical protein
MFRITRSWLDANSRTGKSGWNKRQLALIGIDWPPAAGWMHRVCGTELDENKKKEFEDLAGKSLEGVKIDAGKANMAENPIYRTFPDGKGGWAGAWQGDARYPWTKSK